MITTQNVQKNQKQRIIATPESLKQFFSGYIFPCTAQKTPAVTKGTNWQQWQGDENTINLAGLNCGKAKVVIADIDSYKSVFKKSPESQAFHNEVKKHSQFVQNTQNGGLQYLFKMPKDLKIGNSAPYPGVEIRGGGGYACLYEQFFPHKASYETFQELWKDLPEWPFGELSGKTEHREFGPGKNNRAIPQRAGKAGANADFEAFKEDLADMVFKNRDNPHELKKHLKDFTHKFKLSMIKHYIPSKTKPKLLKIAKDAEIEHNFLKTIKLTKDNIKQPEAFIEGLLLDHEFNFVGGPTKLGKTRALLSMLAKVLKEIKGKGLILSTENDQATMMAPLLKELDAFDSFEFLQDKVAQYFPSEIQHGPDKATYFIKRIQGILPDNTYRCLLIDPLPRFFDWNNEVTVTTFVDGLRTIAKNTNTCIIGIRNDGKSKDYDDVHKTKGSSALADIARHIIRAIPCHKRSALAKQYKKEAAKHKLFVLYTERSGLLKEVAFLFKMEVRKDDFPVAVPVKIAQLSQDTDTVKYLCSRESGKTTRQKIVDYMESRKPKRATIDELRDLLEDTVPEQTIKNTLSGRGFDSRSIGGITYYFPQGGSKAD